MHASRQQQKSLTRLKTRQDFLDIQKNGRRWVSRGLALQVKENNLTQTRVGFTVTKRTDKSAVKRNRMKRRLRAVAADILPLFAQINHDYILVGRIETLNRDYDQLCKDLKWCLRKMDLYEPRPPKPKPQK